MLKALIDVGLHPDLIVGTSAGALNGVVVADRGLKEGIDTLNKLWCGFTRESIFPGGHLAQARQLLATRNSLFPNNRLSALVRQALPVPRFDNFSCRLAPWPPIWRRVTERCSRQANWSRHC